MTLSQGVSFWHAGAEILRSKSLDRNSYDSGDWFNLLDFSLQDNGFGRGLPPSPDNGARWDELAPLLRDPALRPTPEDVRTALAGALDLLRLRRDLPLLRLGSGERIRTKVSFPLSGPSGVRRSSSCSSTTGWGSRWTRGGPGRWSSSTPAGTRPRRSCPGWPGRTGSSRPCSGTGPTPSCGGRAGSRPGGVCGSRP
uniref:alpha-1,6-glucosidase domain-containing protein n=1 Tax=Ornithinimicrobium sp. CNJ-824 TaxID=1904966 RepID=UPI001EDB8178|nr:alpha-1,6-glucosidase domain-containing protein [Ornithinimicrobium sp. CNJ-824]